MKVLFATSECVPFVKTGGLADVVGALPSELNKEGCDARVILPKYSAIPDKYKNGLFLEAVFNIWHLYVSTQFY